MKNLITRLARDVASPRKSKKLKAVFLIFCSFFLAPLLFGVASSIYLNKTLHELAYTRRQAIALPVAKALEERLNKFVTLGQAISIHPRVRDAVLANDWENAAEILNIFHTFVDEPYLDRITLEDASGILRADTPPATGVVGKDFSYRDWYQGVQRTGKSYVSEVYRRTAQPAYNVAAIATPIFNEKGLLQGILLLQLRMDMFSDWIESIQLAPGGFVYILDQYNHVVAHPNIDPQEEIIDFSSAPIATLLQEKGSGVEVTYNPIEQEERLTAFEKIERYGWSIVVQEPTRSAFLIQRFVVTSFSLLYIIGMLFFALLVRPIVQAVNANNSPSQ